MLFVATRLIYKIVLYYLIDIQMELVKCVLLLMLIYLQVIEAFYIPGVAPTNFRVGDKVEVKVCSV